MIKSSEKLFRACCADEGDAAQAYPSLPPSLQYPPRSGVARTPRIWPCGSGNRCQDCGRGVPRTEPTRPDGSSNPTRLPPVPSRTNLRSLGFAMTVNVARPERHSNWRVPESPTAFGSGNPRLYFLPVLPTFLERINPQSSSRPTRRIGGAGR